MQVVDLDAPISKYLPSYPAAQGCRVTVRHLLTQTSGIPNVGNDLLRLLLGQSVAAPK